MDLTFNRRQKDCSGDFVTYIFRLSLNKKKNLAKNNTCGRYSGNRSQHWVYKTLQERFYENIITFLPNQNEFPRQIGLTKT